MKICIILGTRPEIIKFSPIIRECRRLGLDYFVLHTGQHYSANMDKVFFEQLDLPNADYNLDVGSGSHAEQTGRMLIGIEKVLQKEDPDVVLVEGDTNTVLAGALAAVKLKIGVGHVEAGLRSYDRTMPEEINRILTDHCSDFLFAPTKKSELILLREGILKEKIFLTGNTVVDAIYQNLEISKRKRRILKGLEMVGREYDLPVIYPIHPRAKKQIGVFNFKINGVKLVDPLDYLGFIQLESNAKLILTDSGGVQEEACILTVPCVTLRYNTERPETLDVGSNLLAGTDPNMIVKKARLMLNRHNTWENPFGDGKAGKKIIGILKQFT